MQDRERNQLVSAFIFASSVGITLVSNLAAGYFLGRWVDEQLGSQPTATAIGIMLGMAMGVWAILKWIIRDYIKG